LSKFLYALTILIESAVGTYIDLDIFYLGIAYLSYLASNRNKDYSSEDKGGW
jgi:hypothetical protein